MIKSSITKILLSLIIVILSQTITRAEQLEWPDERVWMSSWSREVKEQNEFCTPGSINCGNSNSGAPGKLTFNYDFNFSDAFINFVTLGAKRYLQTPPAYNSIFITEEFIAGTTNNTIGYRKSTTCMSGWTNTETITISNGITIGTQYFQLQKANGHLSEITYADTEVYNRFEVTDNSIVSFQCRNGDEDYLYTYKIFFVMNEMEMNQNGGLELGAHIHWNEMSNDAGPVYNGYYERPYYGFSGYVKIIVRGQRSYKFSVTPRSNKPYSNYEIVAVERSSFQYEPK